MTRLPNVNRFGDPIAPSQVNRFGDPIGLEQPEPERTSLFTTKQFEANKKIRALYDELPDGDQKTRLGAALTELEDTGREVAKGVVDASLNLPGFSDQPQFARRAVEGAAAVGTVLENTIDRFIGREDNADQRRRVMESLRAYNASLDKESVLGKTVGPIIGEVESSLTQGTLTAPAGGLKAISAMYALQGVDKGYVEKKDAGGSEKEAIAHGLVQGGIDGLVTFLGGKLAGRLGLESGETLSPGVANAVKSLANKSGIKKILGSSFMEAGEESLQELMTALEEVRSDVNPNAMKGLWKRVAKAATVGAAGGSVSPSVGALETKWRKFQANLPDVVQGAAAAEQAIARNTLTDEFSESMNRKTFEQATGLRNTTKLFRDSYIETVKRFLASESGSAGLPPNDQPPPADQPIAGVPTPPTSVKNEVMAKDREILDLARVPETEREAWADLIPLARQNNIMAPENAERIVADVNTKPRRLTTMESIGLTFYAKDLKDQITAIRTQPGWENDQTQVARIAELQDSFDRLSLATKVAGGKAGQELAVRRFMLDGQEFDAPVILAQARTTKGSDLTPEEKGKFEGYIRELEDIHKQLKKETDQAKREDLELREHKLKMQIRGDIQSLRTRSTYEQVRDSVNLFKGLKASFDLPPIGRQGMFFLMSHPATTGKAFGRGVKAIFSEKAAFKMNKDGAKRRNADLYEKSGLALHEEGSQDITRREEVFQSKLVDSIPGIQSSQRGYTTFLNQLRMDMFDSLTATLSKNGVPTEEESKAIANFVNVATGRGGLGARDAVLSEMGVLFFSPRYWLSRVQLLAGQPLVGGSARTRKLIAGEYARSILGLALFYSLGQMAFGDDPDYSVSTDIESSDLGRLSFGDQVIDPVAGLSRHIAFVSRAADAISGTLSGDRKKGDTVNPTLAMESYIRGQAAPIPGLAYTLYKGQTFDKQKPSAEQIVNDLVIPMSPGDLIESLQKYGLDERTARSLVSFVGFSVSNRGN